MLEIALSTDPIKRSVQIASCSAMGLEYRASKHGISHELARKLIEAGADPAETVKIICNGKPVFKNDWPLSKWADSRLTENDDRGFQWSRYEKPPEFMQRSNRTARFGPSGVVGRTDHSQARCPLSVAKQT